MKREFNVSSQPVAASNRTYYRAAVISLYALIFMVILYGVITFVWNNAFESGAAITIYPIYVFFFSPIPLIIISVSTVIVMAICAVANFARSIGILVAIFGTSCLFLCLSLVESSGRDDASIIETNHIYHRVILGMPMNDTDENNAILIECDSSGTFCRSLKHGLYGRDSSQ